MKTSKIETIVKIIIAIVVGLVLGLTVFTSIKHNQQDKQNLTYQKSNSINQLASSDEKEKKPKAVKGYEGLKVKNYYSASDLDTSKIPTTKAVKTLVKKLMNIKDEDSIKTLEGNYHFSKNFKSQLPNGKLSVLKYSSDYPYSVTNIRVGLDYNNISTTNISYLIDVNRENSHYYYNITFYGFKVTDIRQILSN